MKVMSYFIDVKMKNKKNEATGIPIAENILGNISNL